MGSMSKKNKISMHENEESEENIQIKEEEK